MNTIILLEKLKDDNPDLAELITSIENLDSPIESLLDRLKETGLVSKPYQEEEE